MSKQLLDQYILDQILGVEKTKIRVEFSDVAETEIVQIAKTENGYYIKMLFCQWKEITKDQYDDLYNNSSYNATYDDGFAYNYPAVNELKEMFFGEQVRRHSYNEFCDLFYNNKLSRENMGFLADMYTTESSGVKELRRLQKEM
jgi:hypothetical protein